MSRPEVSIVIPQYGKWDMTHNRLWEIYDRCLTWTPQMEIVIMEDASGEQKMNHNFWRRGGMFKSFYFIESKRNRGFGRNSNLGLHIATGRIKILLSNDVVIRSDIITKIQRKLAENEKQVIGARLLDWDTGWNVFDGKLFPYLEGFLLAGTERLWKEIKFDPIYGKYDYEDVDFSTQAQEQGYELTSLKCTNEEVFHIGGGTIYAVDGVEKRKEHTEKNREIFRKKWIK